MLMQQEDEHTSAIVSWFTCIYIYIVLETALVVVLKHLAIET